MTLNRAALVGLLLSSSTPAMNARPGNPDARAAEAEARMTHDECYSLLVSFMALKLTDASLKDSHAEEVPPREIRRDEIAALCCMSTCRFRNFP